MRLWHERLKIKSNDLRAHKDRAVWMREWFRSEPERNYREN